MPSLTGNLATLSSYNTGIVSLMMHDTSVMHQTRHAVRPISGCARWLQPEAFIPKIVVVTATWLPSPEVSSYSALPLDCCTVPSE